MNQDHLAERVAYKLIHHACRLQAGDVALLSGRRDQLDLLLRLEFHALAAGARAVILIEDEARLRRLLNELPPASAANERLSLISIAQTVTHVLDLTNGAPDLRGLPQKTLQAWQDANHTLQAALRQHQRARIEIALPSRRQAQRLRQPFHPYNDAIWRALDTDYALMEQRGRLLQAALSDAPLLRLSDARGAELTLRLAAGAPRQRDDGILSPEALAEAGGYVTMLLPAGAFRVAVAEGSAEGEVIIDAGWFQGKPLRHLRLRFHAGRVVGMEGAGAAQAEAALATDAGAGARATNGNENAEAQPRQAPASVGAPLLSKLSIGLNPAVTSLRPYPLGQEASLLAYRRAGAVFLTLSGNRPASAWSLGLARPMLEVDGQVLLRGGEFAAS
jgi:leucyl aminopeptidase (aminopeptidase T)